jgi:DNA-binding NarL/FixJ family response regulator
MVVNDEYPQGADCAHRQIKTLMASIPFGPNGPWKEWNALHSIRSKRGHLGFKDTELPTTSFIKHPHGTSMNKSVLIIEDHPLYRDALVQAVRSVAGESAPVAVSTAEDGLRQAANLANLNMILLDLGLPGMSGIEAIQSFTREFPQIPVVVISATDDRQQANAALRAGARYFLSKSASIEIILDITKRIRAGISEAPCWVASEAELGLPVTDEICLTQRQKETLVLLSKGYSNKEIGLCMGLAEITVKTHASAIFRRLGVANRIQAVLAARRLGIEAAQPVAADNLPTPRRL